jgi:hypothetical protein
MLVEESFEFDPKEPEPAGPTPRVVVIYRRRPPVPGLTVPVLILIVAVVVLAYRTVTPDWRGLSFGRRPRPAPVALAVATSVATPKPETSPPLMVRVEARPAQPSPAEGPEPPKPRPRPAAAIGFRPPAEAFDPTPALPKDPTRAEVLAALTHPRPRPAPIAPRPDSDEAPRPWDDIRTEAVRKQAERDNLELLKLQAPEIARRDMRRRLVERASRARVSADADRRAFLAELHLTLERLGDRAGPRIRALCDFYGRATIPEIEDRVARASGNFSRADYYNRVLIGRRYGLPEPVILERIAAIEARNIVARRGPRDENHALVRAATILLSVPWNSTRR